MIERKSPNTVDIFCLFLSSSLGFLFLWMQFFAVIISSTFIFSLVQCYSSLLQSVFIYLTYIDLFPWREFKQDWTDCRLTCFYTLPRGWKCSLRNIVIRYWTPTKNTCKMPIFDEYTLDKLVNLGHLLIYFISKCYITMFLRTIL